MITTLRMAVPAAALAAAAAAGSIHGADPIEHPAFPEDAVRFFSDEVRPLLEVNCFKCHGGTDARGEVKVRSGFQVISRRGILRGGDHGPAYDADNPEASLLLEMVSYRDDDHQMPPSGKLADEEIAVLERWVSLGVPWTADDIDRLVEIEEESAITEINDHTRSHWSYRPMERPAVPEAPDPEWIRNPVDAFVSARLHEAGLHPNEEADRATLIRRAWFDLVGLPPSPDEVAAFVADPDPDAWPKLIDRLLALPQYGEKWGRHWLDLVRYAESNGFERDSEKEFIWRYRDYVVDAFNTDKPFDRFVLEQLAGDELEDATPEALVATGYHRLMQWDDEPADPLQAKYDILDDNVRTTSEALLGMTLGCARCHDHKGDPVSQKDYFRFMAYFHGITPMGKNSVLEEIPLEPSPEDVARWQRESARALGDVNRRLAEIESRARSALAAAPPVDEGLRLGEILVPDAALGGGEWRFTTRQPAEDWSAVGFRPDESWQTGRAGFGSSASAPPAGLETRTPWETSDLWLQATFRLTEIPELVRLRLRPDDRVELHLNGQPIRTFDRASSDPVTWTLDAAAMNVLQTGRNVLAVRVTDTDGTRFFDARLASGAMADDLESLILAKGESLLPENDVRTYRDLVAERNRLEMPEPDGVLAMVVSEHGPQPEPMHVHIRGNAGAPGDPVEPGIPEIFGMENPPIPEPEPGAASSGRRLALAQWITRPDNPRTARVMANRLWQHHFGRGLSPSPNDFGFLGEGVTHPELLDWLATEFVERGWSLKAMHRLLMTSSTYRMSSAGRPDGLEKDPQNLLLWRYDMRRLTAEEIRDTILAVTGELDLTVGGPSVFIPLPDEVLATSSKGAGMWGKSRPGDAGRRSIYVTLKRSLKPPQLTDFDLADTDASCPVRFTTTVPIQALNTLNSANYAERARRFAERLRREHPGDLAAQLERGFQLALSRPVSPEERDTALAFIDRMRSGHGLSEHDALDRFALLVLNLNEFIYLD